MDTAQFRFVRLHGSGEVEFWVGDVPAWDEFCFSTVAIRSGDPVWTQRIDLDPLTDSWSEFRANGKGEIVFGSSVIPPIFAVRAIHSPDNYHGPDGSFTLYAVTRTDCAAYSLGEAEFIADKFRDGSLGPDLPLRQVVIQRNCLRHGWQTVDAGGGCGRCVQEYDDVLMDAWADNLP